MYMVDKLEQDIDVRKIYLHILFLYSFFLMLVLLFLYRSTVLQNHKFPHYASGVKDFKVCYNAILRFQKKIFLDLQIVL